MKIGDLHEKYYIITLKIIPLFTVPIYSEAIYCLIYKSPNFHKYYKTLLILHVVYSFVGEFYNSICFIPVVHLPIIGYNASGIFTKIGVPPMIQLFLYFIIFQMNASTMLHLLLQRLIAIIPTTFRNYKTSINVVNTTIILIYFFSLVSFVSFLFLYEDQQDAKSYLVSKTSEEDLPSYFWSPSYVVSSTTTNGFQTFLSILAFYAIFYALFCLTLPTVTFHILRKNKHHFSEKVLDGHKMALKSLLVQVLVIISHLLIPMIVFILEIEKHLKDPVLSDLSMIIFQIHGAASVMAMLFANKPYWNIIKIQISTVFSLVFLCNTHRDVVEGPKEAERPDQQDHASES